MTTNRIAPTAIFPTGEGEVRLNATHVRDYPQSTLKGELHAAHMQDLATRIRDYFLGIQGVKGAAEVGGGTVPMNDVKVRGRSPFDGVRAMREAMGEEVPLMALIRSNAGAAMDDLPPDVVKSYIKQYHAAGMDVFRNFHAHNDPRQFRHVYDAVKEVGGHFQAAYSWAVNNDEPALYNPRSVVKFFHQLLDMGIVPDSLVLKDPSGVLTPAMAELITLEVKNDPRLKGFAFGIHTHNQMGQAPSACFAAANAGANFVDTGPSFNNVPAQPAMPTMFHMLDNQSLNLGFGNDREAKLAAQAGLIATDERAKQIAQSYAEGRRPRMEDVTVENHGIAGGQSSIAYGEMVQAGLMTKEEAEAGVPIFTKYPELQELIRIVRSDAGAVCQVTPAADRYFREATRLLLGSLSHRSDSDKFYAKAAELAQANFNPSFAHILTGAAGTTAKEIKPELQKQALFERVKKQAAELGVDGLSDDSLRDMVDAMYRLSEPDRARQRATLVEEQIHAYQEMREKAAATAPAGSPEARIAALYRNHIALIEQKLEVAAGENPNLPRTLKDVIEDGLQEHAALRHTALESDATPEGIYDRLQYGTISEDDFRTHYAAALPESLQAQPYAIQQKLLAAASVTTVVASDTMAPGLEKAKQSLIAKSQASQFPLPLNANEFAEAVTVEGLFGSIKVPVVENGKKHDRDIVSYLYANRGNPGKWMIPDDKSLSVPEETTTAAKVRFSVEVPNAKTFDDVRAAIHAVNTADSRDDNEADAAKNHVAGIKHAVICAPEVNGHAGKHVYQVILSAERPLDKTTRKPSQTADMMAVRDFIAKVATQLGGEVYQSRVNQVAASRENGARQIG